jgi:hypothetical protein
MEGGDVREKASNTHWKINIDYGLRDELVNHFDRGTLYYAKELFLPIDPRKHDGYIQQRGLTPTGNDLYILQYTDLMNLVPHFYKDIEHPYMRGRNLSGGKLVKGGDTTK